MRKKKKRKDAPYQNSLRKSILNHIGIPPYSFQFGKTEKKMPMPDKCQSNQSLYILLVRMLNNTIIQESSLTVSHKDKNSLNMTRISTLRYVSTQDK